MERKTRFELATPSLARRCSTTEPLPLTPFGSRPYHAKKVWVNAAASPLKGVLRGLGRTPSGGCPEPEFSDVRAVEPPTPGDILLTVYSLQEAGACPFDV